MAICVIIPTAARPTLTRIVNELIPQLATDDEVLVVSDGYYTEVAKLLPVHPKVRHLNFGPNNMAGYPQRNFGMTQTNRDHLWFIDDDDRAAPYALKAIRRVITDYPTRPIFFRTIYNEKNIWDDEEIRIGNISTQCIVVPNDKERLGQWGNRYEGDYDFAVSTAALYPEGPVWVPQVISVIGVRHSTYEDKKKVNNWVFDEYEP